MCGRLNTVARKRRIANFAPGTHCTKDSPSLGEDATSTAQQGC